MIKNFRLVFLLFLLLNYAITPIVLATTQLRYPPAQDKNNITHDYIVGLLALILDKTSKEYGGMEVIDSTFMTQGRAEIELQRGTNVDVVSFGSSIERENKFLAIKIPILRGILGFRMSIIRKDFESEFSQIKTIDDLKKYSACQGMHWPDSDILEAAELKVIRNASHESLFRQVVAKRCDYFPRSVQEGPLEIALKTKKYPELMFYRHLIIHYPYPAYFFVSKNNNALHQRLFKGFNLAIEDGSFQRYLHSHIGTKDVFPASKWLNNTIVEITNPLLSEGTDIDNSLYWIRSKD
ncbi:MAG: hypothetical protein HRU24_14890 [Gammaproteobacteria bacterium]|nr:hypothetical protein [Gammaproteobacteria bacterium]